jgi:hypothetical protein
MADEDFEAPNLALRCSSEKILYVTVRSWEQDLQ